MRTSPRKSDEGAKNPACCASLLSLENIWIPKFNDVNRVHLDARQKIDLLTVLREKHAAM